MANSRIARFIMEAAPPQYVTVMRHRTSKMLDTITEEDHREISSPNNDNHPHTSSSSPRSLSSPLSLSPSSSLPPSSASSVSLPSADTKNFLKEVHRSLSILNH